ncbi:MAG TPA: hypothetical protein PLF42_05970, partial [Anaerolineales bacterium]|nr:hypothetical protein [Anaerolineales bacterium]
PKRVYGQKGGPATRMGNVAGYRAAFIEAAEYRDKRKGGEGGGKREHDGFAVRMGTQGCRGEFHG